MKAMILAAGEGTRLRPLTSCRPKPIIPVVNRPLLEHTIDLLIKHGIHEIIINLHYYPESIRECLGDGQRFGIRIIYSEEVELLGTAGAVKKVESLLDDTFLVVYGDNLIDADLSALINAHHEKEGLATIALFEAPDPTACGIVELDISSRVRDFIEKPSSNRVVSNTANAGIYVLEPTILNYIPKSTFYDFGQQVFPQMLVAGEPVFGHLLGGYLKDIGTFGGYLSAHRDYIYRSLCQLSRPQNTQISASASISEHAILGPGTSLAEEAQLISWSSIGPECIIGGSSRVSESVLWENVEVGSDTHITGAVIADHCHIGNHVTVEPGVVLGPGCVITDGTTVPSGTLLAEGSYYKGNVHDYHTDAVKDQFCRRGH